MARMSIVRLRPMRKPNTFAVLDGKMAREQHKGTLHDSGRVD